MSKADFDLWSNSTVPWYIMEPDPDGSGWWRAMRSDSDEWFRIPPPPPIYPFCGDEE